MSCYFPTTPNTTLRKGAGGETCFPRLFFPRWTEGEVGRGGVVVLLALSLFELADQAGGHDQVVAFQVRGGAQRRKGVLAAAGGGGADRLADVGLLVLL